MINFLLSLSISSGALIISIASVTISLLIGNNTNKTIKKITTLLIPFVLSNVLYWAPVIIGRDALEYIAWAGLFIIPWTIAGTLSVCSVRHIINIWQKRQD
ncbi:MAG TPA: hypothetical protein VN642_01800 [Dongiaceae bacterium]|nr:hypothetical protein [Dongiaceae bacterium]